MAYEVGRGATYCGWPYKENLLWVRSFDTIEDLRLALLAFKRTYTEQWMLEKYDYRSPAQVRRDLGGLA